MRFAASTRSLAGLVWCLASIVLVSAAQLALKYAMLHLPQLSPATVEVLLQSRYVFPLAMLFCGLLGYALSMICWFLALRRLPLNRAYPMLSLSYVLVCLLAVILPCFDERLTLLKICGIACIVLGIWLINPKKAKNRLASNA